MRGKGLARFPDQQGLDVLPAGASGPGGLGLIDIGVFQLPVSYTHLCGGTADTLTERRAQVLLKLVRPVGQDMPFFEALAASMGYPATVEEFRPFAADESGAEDYLNDAPGGAVVDRSTSPATFQPSQYHGWLFVFRLNVAEAYPARWFQADSSGAEDRLATWGNSEFECAINRAKPAHTIALFGYGAQGE